MAISKKTGREYQSRCDRGYAAAQLTYKPTRYPKGFDRWGQPITCGVRDEDGNECRRRVVGIDPRCEYHQRLHEARRGGSGERP